MVLVESADSQAPTSPPCRRDHHRSRCCRRLRRPRCRQRRRRRHSPVLLFVPHLPLAPSCLLALPSNAKEEKNVTLNIIETL
jgi:hypothetical protein